MLNDFEINIKHADNLIIEGRAFINGHYVSSQKNTTFACYSPIDNRLLKDVTQCDPEDVEQAVICARQSFESGDWSCMAARDRKTVLLAWASLLKDHFDELCLLETLDSGKPIQDVINCDLPLSIECLTWYAEAIDKIHGECIPTNDAYLSLVTQEPIGVVAAIVPWNYPLLMAMWKIAPALAVGNSVILKPSEKSPLTAIRVAQLAHQAGLPRGVFNVLPGDGAVGMLLSQHRDVDCISFTGSGPTGRKIMHAAADSNLKRVWLELGGKTPHIIFDDCPDLDRAALSIANGIFMNMGEVCNAGSRLLVHRSLKDELIKRLTKIATTFYPENPLNPKTKMGAVIDQSHLNRILKYIDMGRKDSDLLIGGEVAHKKTGGFYIEPTIFDCADHTVKIAREEIFGPVLSVITFDDIDEAVMIANDTEYGLAAGLWTSDFNRAHVLAKKLRSGTVWINCFDEPSDMNFPFGGYKQSGNGRDKSLHALLKYVELKTTIFRIAS